MLLAKHTQLQPVNCLISHQSISPNKERWRAVKTQWRVRVNERVPKEKKQAKAVVGFSTERQGMHLFGVCTTTSYLTQAVDGLLLGRRLQLYHFTVTLIAGYSMWGFVLLCMYVNLSPSWTTKWEHFENENHMGFLIDQFLLPAHVALFHSENQWK